MNSDQHGEEPDELKQFQQQQTARQGGSCAMRTEAAVAMPWGHGICGGSSGSAGRCDGIGSGYGSRKCSGSKGGTSSICASFWVGLVTSQSVLASRQQRLELAPVHFECFVQVLESIGKQNLKLHDGIMSRLRQAAGEASGEAGGSGAA